MTIDYGTMCCEMGKYLDHLLKEPNLSKVEECFSKNFVCFSIITNGNNKEVTEDSRDIFIANLAKGHFKNIAQQDGKWLIENTSYDYEPKSENKIITKVSSDQYRFGGGALENGEGWYRLESYIVSTFCLEEGNIKISKLSQKKYNKTKFVDRPLLNLKV